MQAPPLAVDFGRRLFAGLCVAAFVASSAGAASAMNDSRTAAAGSIGIRLVDIPVSAATDPRAQIYVIDHLAPGTMIHRRVEVTNTSAQTAHILLYSAAAAIENGSFVGAPGNTANDVSNWTSISPNSVDVPAAGRATATVTIDVPKDAPPGEQYGVIWAEIRSADSTAGVTQVNRVGIREYLSIGSGGPAAANFTIDSLSAGRSSNGEPTVLAYVHNTGGRALDMSGTLQLAAGPGGLNAGPFPATLGTSLAIGDTEAVTIVLDRQIPAGPWDAYITLRSGLLERDAKATITFPGAGVASLVTPLHKPGSHLRAIAAAGGILLLAVGGVVIVGRRLSRRAKTAST